jgi:drug/metabolite transporter (DMT)-like permease
MRVFGILFAIAGVILLAYGGLTFFVPREVVDLGTVSIHVRENLAIPVPPILGLLLLVVGLVMIMSAPSAVAVVQQQPPANQPR